MTIEQLQIISIILGIFLLLITILYAFFLNSLKEKIKDYKCKISEKDINLNKLYKEKLNLEQDIKIINQTFEETEKDLNSFRILLKSDLSDNLRFKNKKGETIISNIVKIRTEVTKKTSTSSDKGDDYIFKVFPYIRKWVDGAMKNLPVTAYIEPN